MDFFEATGIQSSNFKGKNMSSQPGGDMIVKVLTMYPLLSAEWLLRGEGNMLKDLSDFNEDSNAEGRCIEELLPKELLDKFLTTIQDQAQEIGQLKARIKDLESRLEKTAHDASTGDIVNVG